MVSAERTPTIMTSDGEMMNEPVGPVIDDELVDCLMAQVDAEGLDLLGPDGVLTELTSRILSRGLEVEMTDHLGYEKGDRAGWGSGNNRNGSYPKNVQTDAGTVGVEMPRDRNATFEPQLIPKHQRRLRGFNDLVISLVARGMTVRDTQAHLQEIYGVQVSPELISKVTDAIVPELRAWQQRPLDAVYPILYLDAIVVKVRSDHVVVNRPVYIAMAINVDGQKAVTKALKPVYQAANVDALDHFEAEWGDMYPAIVDLWRRNWERFTPFLAFDAAIRKIIYTTNAIESLNYQLRKVTKTRGHFPTNDAVLKILYLAIRNIGNNRGGELGTGTQGWKRALKRVRHHLPRTSRPNNMNPTPHTKNLTSPGG